MPKDNIVDFSTLLRRYHGASSEDLVAVLCPLLLPLTSIDKSIVRLPGQSHFKATFTIKIDDLNREVLVVGRTGKFVSGSYSAGGVWGEIAKGRIIAVDHNLGLATGEIYAGQAGSQNALQLALDLMDEGALLEIDQYGAAAKVLSGLTEHSLARLAHKSGYTVYRMPEDMAKHLGAYANYDFEFEKDGVRKRIEVKSLWGTNTRFARLIHSTTTRPRGEPSEWTIEQTKNYYPTSSCKFETQDIFAVSLFLRTGNIHDFAFARSVSKADKEHGLPFARQYPDHVNQNPLCEIGNGSWFSTLDEVWDLD